MTISFYPGVAAAADAGIFIPRNNLKGLLTDSELADAEPEILKQSKFLAAFLTTIVDTVTENRANPSALATALGFTATKGTPSGTSQGRFTQLFTMNWATVINHISNAIEVIPTPSSGTFNGVGRLRINDIFPNAAAIANGANTPGAGVLIANADVTLYGADDSTAVNNDDAGRKWFGAMFRYLFEAIPLRNTTPANAVASALTARALGTVSNFTLPANATVTTNPTTGLAASELNRLDIYSRSCSFTIEYAINEATQTYEVFVA